MALAARQTVQWRVASLRHLALLLTLATPCLASAKTLEFWAVTSDLNDVIMYRGLAKDFEKKTGVQVNVTPLGWGGFQAKYFTSMAAGLPPDAGVTNLGGPFEYGSVGGLVDFNKEFPKESKELQGEFAPQVLDGFKIGNQLFAVPSDLTTLVLFYRKDIFAELGLQPPKTWSELDQVIAKLEAAGYQYYFGFTADSQWAVPFLYTMPYGLPGISLDPEGKPKLDWLNPKYQEGIFEAIKLWDFHISPGRNLGGRAIGMFASNDKETACPLMFDLTGTADQIRITQPNLNGKWGLAPWPKADDGRPYNVTGGTSFVIFRESKLKREAMEWIQYLNTVETQEKMILNHLNRGENSGLMVSSVKGLWTHETDAFWQRPELQPTEEQRSVLQKIVPTLATLPSVHGATEASTMESNMLDSMATYVQDHLQSAADKLGISRTDLIRGFARGQYQDQQAALYKDVKDRIRQQYAEIAPKALATLNDATENYKARFGDILQRLPEAERATDAMKVAKIVAGVVLALCLAGILGFKRLRKHWVSYLFVATPMVLALIFVFVPAAVALYLSFTQYHPVLPLSTAHWVGLQNYGELVHSGDLASSLGRTVYYSVATVPIGIILALVFAYLLNSKLRGQKIWRFLYFSPLVTSVVSIALIFSQLFLSARQGWLNMVLLRLGLIKDPIPFLTSERSFLQCVIALAIWHGLAFTILVFLAGFQQVPNELHEAASVDGAGALRRFWNIAVPGVRPQVFFISVLGVIGSFQVFETIYMLANKSGDAGARFGPNDSGLTVVPQLYHYGFETFEMGKASALAYVLFVIILALTAVQLKIYRRGES